MKIVQVADSIRYQTMRSEELREAYLLTDLFQTGEVELVYVDLDRAIVGSAVPTKGPLSLPCDDALRAAYFTERRELGVLNIGPQGSVVVDGVRFELARLDALYVGRGSREVSFASADLDAPSEFYLLSYPAHAVHATRLIRAAEQQSIKLGSMETANERRITKLIHLDGPRSCQLVMGFTQLTTGSVWNTMPAHTHFRRSEIYLYFDVPADHRVIHFMGPAKETRHLVIANKQVAISPGWSIHSGVGTASYSFCWGMGGENQDYNDMDKLAIADL